MGGNEEFSAFLPDFSFGGDDLKISFWEDDLGCGEIFAIRKAKCMPAQFW